MGVKSKRKRKVAASDSEMDDEEDDASVLAPITGKRKRGGSTTSGGSGFSMPPLKYQAGGSGIHRPISSAGKGKKKESHEPGAEYRSRKAKGDVKKKGKPDPYAYIPLSRKTLNKRKKVKSAGQFKNIIQAAKKGAQKGIKAKAKFARR